MDSLVKDVMAVVGLDVKDRKISNVSLRVGAMNVQELLGFSEDTDEMALLPLTNKKYNLKVAITDSFPLEFEEKQVPAASSVPGEQSAPRNVQVCIQQFYDLFLTSTFIRFPQQHLPRLGWQCHLQG